MKDIDLRKLKREELLEIMLKQQQIIDQKNDEIERLKSKLREREITIENAGSIAEAALRINRVFEAAERAASQYVYSVKKEALKRELHEKEGSKK